MAVMLFGKPKEIQRLEAENKALKAKLDALMCGQYEKRIRELEAALRTAHSYVAGDWFPHMSRGGVSKRDATRHIEAALNIKKGKRK